MAQKGEFTKRAFLNGKIDLAQAEAVLDLVKAQTREGAGLAVRQLEGRLSRIVISTRIRLLGMMAELEARIDFPEDLPSLNYNAFIKRLQPFIKEIDKLLASSVSGRIYREGLPMAIIGKPNVGKSSLLNALLGEERAIVTEIPGTTRDAIEETLSVQGMPLRIIDTAGIRHPRDKAEEFGVDRAEKELDAAELALIVIDASEGLDGLDRMVLNRATGKPGIVVLNKVDLGTKASLAEVDALSKGMTAFKTSALRRKGIEELKFGILELIKAGFNLPGEDAITINVRHRECLLKAKEGLERSLASCRKGLPVDFITIDLKDAILALGEVTGELVSEEVVNTIFEHFCVGK